MKNNRVYKVVYNGDIPEIIKTFVSGFADRNINDCYDLDSEISFLVCDLKVAHGNTDNDGNGWLCNLPNVTPAWTVKITIN